MHSFIRKRRPRSLWGLRRRLAPRWLSGGGLHREIGERELRGDRGDRREPSWFLPELPTNNREIGEVRENDFYREIGEIRENDFYREIGEIREMHSSLNSLISCEDLPTGRDGDDELHGDRGDQGDAFFP